jgi:hypothetical protein
LLGGAVVMAAFALSASSALPTKIANPNAVPTGGTGQRRMNAQIVPS